MARDYIESGKYSPGMMQARRNALNFYEMWGVYSGQKVTAFSRALQDGGGEHAVIDIWVFRAFDLPASRANHRVAVERLRRAARRLQWPVAEAQAALWVGTRAVCGFTNHDPISMA